MYSINERQTIYNQLLNLYENMDEIRGAVLLGSGAKGFTDKYSDLDFMLSVKDSDFVKSELLTKIKDMGYAFGRIVEFTKIQYLIIAILDNFLELNISILPFENIVSRSNQWKVVLDKDNNLEHKMKDTWNQVPQNSINEKIENNNLIFETVYYLRRGYFELARGNLLYSANLISLIRENIFIIECLKEGKKAHQFKNYASLDTHFLEEMKKTFPSSVTEDSILQAFISTQKIFFHLIQSLFNHQYDHYKQILNTYIEGLFSK